MTCDNPTAHEQNWEIIDRRREARRVWCPACHDDWWTDEEDEETPEDVDDFADQLDPDPPPRPFR